MKGFWTIYRKDLTSLFNSPIAYIVIAFFLSVSAGIFTQYIFVVKRAELRHLFETVLPITLPIFLGAVTMRTWAEEHRQGTIELLMTLPMRLSTVVIGKYLAIVTFYLIMLLSTFPMPAVLVVAWDAELGPIVSGYLGAFAMGMFFLGLGTFVSAHTRDQIVSFIVSCSIGIVFTLAGFHIMTDWLDGWAVGLGTFIRRQISVPAHMESFGKGIIDLSDLGFFLSLSAALVGLTVYTLASRTNVRERDRFLAATTLLSLIGIFAALNFNELSLGRIDTTEGKVYTVSEASSRVLSRLRAPVSITYYVTNVDKMPPEYKSLERDVTDLLRELAEISPKIAYTIEDPATNPVADSKLREKNIQHKMVASEQKDQAQLALVYSAAVITYLDQPEEVIPWIDPVDLSTLEYQLVSTIHRISLERKPKVALFGKMEEPNPYMRAMGQMPRDDYRSAAETLRRQGYEVARIALNSAEPIPADADALVILEPEKLNDRQLYEINRLVRSGRPLFIATQNFKYDYFAATRDGIPVEKLGGSNLDALFSAWGVGVNKEILLDKSFVPLTFEPIPGFRQELPFPNQILLTTENQNTQNGIMNGVGEMLYLWGSSLSVNEEAVKKAGLSSTVLATTSRQTWTLPDDTSIALFSVLTREPDSFVGRQPAIVMLEGTFPDAFAGKAVPAWPDGGEEEKKPDPIVGPSKVILVGCANMFNNSWLNRGNANFYMNAVDVLTHGGDLAQIRGKQYKPKLIGEMTPGESMFRRVFMIGSMAVVCVLVGMIRWIMRRRGREAYARSLAQ